MKFGSVERAAPPRAAPGVMSGTLRRGAVAQSGLALVVVALALLEVLVVASHIEAIVARTVGHRPATRVNADICAGALFSIEAPPAPPALLAVLDEPAHTPVIAVSRCRAVLAIVALPYDGGAVADGAIRRVGDAFARRETPVSVRIPR